MSIATRVPVEKDGIAHVLAIAVRIFVRMGCMKIVPIQKVMTYLFALLFFLTPLYMSSSTSELFEFNKMLVIYLITGCALSLWVAHMLIAQKFIFRKNILMYPLGLFVLSQIISTVTSIDPHTSLFGYYGRFNGGLLSIGAYVLLFFLIVTYASVKSSMRIQESIEKILQVSMISSVCVMLWGLPSHFGYDPSCWLFSGSLDVACWTEQFKPTIRLFSTLGQPNWLAAYLVIHFIIGMYFYLKEKMPAWRWIYGGYSVSTWILILFTRSRSAYLALIVSGAVAVTYALSKGAFKKHGWDKVTLTIVGLLLLAVVCIGTGSQKVDRYIYAPAFFQSQQAKPSSVPQMTGSITDSASIRKIVWQGAFGLGLEYPVFGTGVETFAYSYSFVRPLEHNLTSEWDFIYNKAHNEYFNYLATTGFVGLLAYLLVSAVVLLQLKRAYDGTLTIQQERMVVMLECAYISIMVTNFFGFSTSTINLFYYSIPAWLIVTIYGDTFQPIKHTVTVLEKDAVRLIVPALMFVASFWFVIGYSRADRAYARADALINTGSYAEALPYLYTSYGLRHEHVYADKISQVLAQGALQESQSQGASYCVSERGESDSCITLAETFSDRATEGSPMNIAYIRTKARNNFTFYQATGEQKYIDGAFEDLDKARRIAPTDPKLPYLRGLFALGRYELTPKPTQKDRDTLKLMGLPSIEFALKLKPNYADAYYIKGLMQKSLNDTSGAKKTFTYLLDSIDPNYEQARQELKSL